MAFFLFQSIANSQVIENIQNKDLVEKSYSVCAYYLIYFELKELNLPDYLSKFNQKFKLNDNSIPSFKDFVSFINENDTLKYLKLITSHIDETRKKLEKESFPNENIFIVSLLNSVFSGDLKDLKFSKYPEKISNVNTVILNELNRMFLLEKLQQQSINYSNPAKDESEKESFSNKFYYEYLQYILIIIGILLIILYSMIFKLSQRLKLLSVNNPDSNREEIVRIKQDLKKYIEISNNFIKKIELHNELENLKKDLLKKIDAQISERLNESSIIVKMPEEKPNKFYFPYPDKERGFDIQKKSMIFEPTESIYEITFTNENTGKFKICNHETVVRRIVQLTHVYIEPACDELNDFNSDARSIVTVEEGEVEKNGDYYRIVKKAKIRYE